MPSTDNLNLRLNYRGGGNQQNRMNADKLKSLKKALLYSYQAATALLTDGREFRCLINPDKQSLELDTKIISIPFEDLCLNGGSGNSGDMSQSDNQVTEGKWEDMEDLIAILEYVDDVWEDMVSDSEIENLPDPSQEFVPIPEGIQEIGMKEGDTFCWKENGSRWLVYLRRLEETAYFRANIRRCRYILTLGNGSKYWVYVRGPVEQSILWSQVSNNYFNKLNYTLMVYITSNEETLEYFHRFKKIMINGQPWEVQVADSISTPGIITITLKETYNNTAETDIDKAVQKATTKEEAQEQDIETPYIYGLNEVYPYDVRQYELKNYFGPIGHWIIKDTTRSNMVKLAQEQELSVELNIVTGKSGKLVLSYVTDDSEVAALEIKVKSL